MTRSFNTVNRGSISTTGKLTGFIGNQSSILHKGFNKEIGIARSRDVKMSGMKTQETTTVSPVEQLMTPSNGMSF